jgi:hypothetical protein
MIKAKLTSPGWVQRALSQAQEETLEMPEDVWNPLKVTSSPLVRRHALDGQIRSPFATVMRCAAAPKRRAQAA